jgi:hypothetical protein
VGPRAGLDATKRENLALPGIKTQAMPQLKRLVAGFPPWRPGLKPGICGGQSGTGAGFIQELQFLLPIFIPSISPQSPSPITRGWCNRPVGAAVPKVPPQ